MGLNQEWCWWNADLLNSTNNFDFTQPPTVRVGGRTFAAFRTVPYPPEDSHETTLGRLPTYTDNDEGIVSCLDMDYDDYDFKMTTSGKYLVSLWTPSHFFANIVGAKGSKKREIEADTGTHIKVPKVGQSGDILITGHSEQGIVSAANRIRMIVLKARERQQITHFVSIPFVNEAIQNSFSTFKHNILHGPFISGLDETIFQSPSKLHLTIATLVLIDEAEANDAIDVLQECKTLVINPALKNIKNLKLKLQGVEIMNDDPIATHILYGKVTVEPSKYKSVFQCIADDIVDTFSRKGLMRKQYDAVKLHVTLLNSSFRKGEENCRQPFDTTYILSEFKDFYFGHVDLDEIHLSIRYTTSKTLYYEALMTVSVN